MSLKFRFSSILLVAVVISCSSVTTPPQAAPPAKLTAGGDTLTSVQQESVRKFRQARRLASVEPRKSCQFWLENAATLKGIYQSVAHLRALEHCPKETTLPFSQDELEPTEPWLREEWYRANLSYATRAKDEAKELKYSLAVGPLEIKQKDQVRLFTRALEIARKTQDEPQAKLAQALLEKAAPRFMTAPQPHQYLTVAADLRRARMFQEARDMYRKVLADEDLSDDDKLRALDGIRMSFKLEKKTEAFLKATREYSAFAREKFLLLKTEGSRSRFGKYIDAKITLARAVWTENSPSEARKILLRAEGEIRGRAPVDESILIRARIEEEAQRYGKALEVLNTIDTNKPMDRGLRTKVLWYRAWNLRRLNRHKDAIAAFEALTQEETTTPLLARNRFWLARTLKDAGEKDRAKQQFEELIETDPIGYYGLLAYRELGRNIPSLGRAKSTSKSPASATSPAAPAQDAPLRPEPSLSTDDAKLFDWLIAIEENDLARRLLDSKTASSRAEFNDGQALDLLQRYARAGQYQTLFSRITEFEPESRRHILDTETALLFPRPWSNLVDDAGKKFEVKPELIYSIMRQESSFNPTARSHADAFGLMQLIPEMAKHAQASTEGIKIDSPEDLYKPEVNIPLGAAFLRGLFKQWDGVFITSVASYNASERAVAGWLKTRNRRDVLEFIEDIPYEETRAYVKLVMRNFVFYSRLSTPLSEIPFPEWCLNGIQPVKP